MNNDRNNLENILYRIVEEISKENAPIVFKGGLAINDILSHENQNNNIERKTVDIDANWTGDVDHNRITKTFEKAIKRVNPNYEIELYRLPDKGKSMGYKIFDNNKVITKIDLDIKNNPFYVIYRINDIDVKYSSKEKIMADKLSALSNEHPFRRAKDLLDIYLILKIENIDFSKIEEILQYDDRELGDFSTMIENKQQMKDSYESLNGITNKPEFNIVWEKVKNYLTDNKLIKDNDSEKDASI